MKINEIFIENLENLTINSILDELEKKDKYRKNCEYLNKNGKLCKIKIDINQECCHIHKRYILEDKLKNIQNVEKTNGLIMNS